jgi:hypothetical protein
MGREARRDIMQRALELPLPESSLTDPQPPPDAALTAEDELWLRFDRYVIGEMVTLYTQTNGWIMLGYASWPSNARGLDAYWQPVGG